MADDPLADPKTAPGPAPTICCVCEDEVYLVFGIDFQPYCRECVDRAAFLALAREHAASLKGQTS